MSRFWNLVPATAVRHTFCMEPEAKMVRAPDGTERVVLELADFQALIDAAGAAAHGLPEVAPVVARLRAVLETAPDEFVPLDELLAEYDALRGSR